jgi:hypothetical protein
MENVSPLDFIEAEVQKRIKSFDERRKFYRAKTQLFTLLVASFSGATTFFIGVGQAYDSKLFSTVALAISAGITVLNAWDGLYSYRRSWVQSNDSLMKLYELSSDIKYEKARSGIQLSSESIDRFYKRYQETLKSANEGWKDNRLMEKGNI